MDQVEAGDRRDEARLRPPSLFLALTEFRAWQEFGASLAFAPLLMAAPRGDGHTALVLPGFMASDASTRLLRAYLRMQGYNALGWELGRNTNGFYGTRETLRARLAKLHKEAGHKIALV
ncbi:MAG: alpha/beta hydrolase, partial [Rhodoblastus sp.]